MVGWWCMEPKRMFLDSFCKKGLYIESFGRPSPLYPSLTPGNIHTLQCERCCVHPWVKFEKKTVEINSKNKKHNLWFSSRPVPPLLKGVFFLNLRGFRDEHPVYFWCLRKICCWKTGIKGSIYWRSPSRLPGSYAQLFICFLHWVKHLKNLWNLREIGGNEAKSLVS